MNTERGLADDDVKGGWKCLVLYAGRVHVLDCILTSNMKRTGETQVAVR